MRIQKMVEDIYQDQKRAEQGGPSHDEGKKEGGDEEYPKTPPPSPSFLDSSLNYPFEKEKI